MRSDNAFSAVEESHIKVHELANRAVKAVNAGNLDEGSQLRDQAHAASQLVAEKLTELGQHMQSASV